MKSHYRKMSANASPRCRTVLGSVLCACSLLAFLPLPSPAASISGDSTTILRMRETSQEATLNPLYEYLHLAATGAAPDGTVSLYFGGWGRLDLADRGGARNTNGDLQYGYLSYRGNRNNLAINVGRQFVTEGVASEIVDGLYLRSDLAAGFGAAAFVGKPVVTEPSYKGGDLIFGGRLAHRGNRYDLGVSALRTQDWHHLRQEVGLDLWLAPMRQIDVTGRSTYNTITDGWQEHAYTFTFAPGEKLKLNAALSQINYRDYFHHVTTTALKLTGSPGLAPGTGLDPNEEVLTLGASAGYAITDKLGFAVDYVNFDYKVAGHTNYYGGRLDYQVVDDYAAGASYHRMDGETSRLTYDEFRIYASKRYGRADATIDIIDIRYDSSIQGIRNGLSVSGAAGFRPVPALRVSADLEYFHSPDFDHNLTGLVKLSYAFDSERRGK